MAEGGRGRYGSSFRYASSTRRPISPCPERVRPPRFAREDDEVEEVEEDMAMGEEIDPWQIELQRQEEMRTVGPPIVISPIPHSRFELPHDSDYILVTQWPVDGKTLKARCYITLPLGATIKDFREVDIPWKTTLQGKELEPARWIVPIIQAEDCDGGKSGTAYIKRPILAYTSRRLDCESRSKRLQTLSDCEVEGLGLQQVRMKRKVNPYPAFFPYATAKAREQDVEWRIVVYDECGEPGPGYELSPPKPDSPDQFPKTPSKTPPSRRYFSSPVRYGRRRRNLRHCQPRAPRESPRPPRGSPRRSPRGSPRSPRRETESDDLLDHCHFEDFGL